MTPQASAPEGKPSEPAAPPATLAEGKSSAPSPAASTPPGDGTSTSSPAPPTLEALEKSLVEKLNARMLELEHKMVAELESRKREAEQNMDEEVNKKRQRLQGDIQDLIDERTEQENKLAVATEQLQDKMQSVSSEQAILDELREKSRAMQKQLQEAAVANHNPGKSEDEKAKQKELLKQKMQASAHKAPPNPPATPNAALASPSTVSSTTPGTESTPAVTEQAMVPVSSQRFTSSTHPEAWQYLYRLTKHKDKCDEEVYNAWHEGSGSIGWLVIIPSGDIILLPQMHSNYILVL